MSVVSQTFPVRSVSALTIINRAYSLLGYLAAGETLSASDAEYGRTTLNSLLDSWETQPYFAPGVDEVSATVSGLPVTIGAGMMINIERPTKVLDGSFIRVNGVDFPITWVTREEYNDISVKSVSSTIPCYGYYDEALPTGNIFLWPYPSTGTELFLQVPTKIPQFVDFDTVATFIPGYQRALEYTLAEELSPGIKELSPVIARNAMLARKAIRRTNIEVPLMSIGGSSGSPYGNFISGS